MISKPTNQQLIEAVCAELTGKVAPNISDAGTKVVLEMALSVLSCAAVRTAKELAWMKEETDAIEVVARRFTEEMPGRRARSPSRHVGATGSSTSTSPRPTTNDQRVSPDGAARQR